MNTALPVLPQSRSSVVHAPTSTNRVFLISRPCLSFVPKQRHQCFLSDGRPDSSPLQSHDFCARPLRGVDGVELDGRPFGEIGAPDVAHGALVEETLAALRVADEATPSLQVLIPRLIFARHHWSLRSNRWPPPLTNPAH